MFTLSLILGCSQKTSSLGPEVPLVTQTVSLKMNEVMTPTRYMPPHSRLVFVMNAGDKADIYTAYTDGSGLVNLTNQAGLLRSPVWSPDGKSIAYASESGVFVMGADGSGTKQVPKSGPLVNPFDWSPDGRFLLVESYQDVNSEIYAVTLDGTRWINLSQNPSEDGSPRWSPEGTRIAFVSDRDSPDGELVFQVYSFNLPRGDVTKLTDFQYGAGWPVWSPDGHNLAISVANDTKGNSNDVYILQSDGKVVRKLTSGTGWNIPLDWSPDGKWVVMLWRWGNNQKITFAAVDGSGSQELNLGVMSLRWQPANNATLLDNLDLQISSLAQETQENTQPIAFINGVLIDGTGGDPVTDAVILIKNGKIVAVGRNGEVIIPPDVQTIDMNGNTILPGFINAHVHAAYSAKTLAAWVKSGVTTVCDLGSGSEQYYFSFRDATLSHPDYARIVAAGPIITTPGGYPIPMWGPEIALEVTSAEDAHEKVGELLDKGADIIKIAVSNTLSAEEIKAITDQAHLRGTLVIAHVDSAKDLELAVDNGVDVAAHMVPEKVSDDLIKKMVMKNFYVIPTAALYVSNFPAAKAQILDNMQRFAAAGGKLVLGDDYGNLGIQLGMPIHDMEYLMQSGLTAMQAILAGTKYASQACNREQELGTLEVGKAADILIVQGDPLEDIHVLLNVEMVLRDGEIVWVGK